MTNSATRKHHKPPAHGQPHRPARTNYAMPSQTGRIQTILDADGYAIFETTRAADWRLEA